jgi:hypothetical protein
LIERAKGQPFEVLYEAKDYLLRNVGPVGIKKILTSDGPFIFSRLGPQMMNHHVSKALLNLIFARSKDAFDALDEQAQAIEPVINETLALSGQIPDSIPDTTQAQIRIHIAALRKSLPAAKGFMVKRKYIDAKDALDETKKLTTSVNLLIRSAQFSAKTPYQSSSETGQSTPLGGGNMSSVSEVNYDPTRSPVPGKQIKITHGVFKPEMMEYDNSVAGADLSGIPLFGSNFSNRSVATYKLDKLFGFGLTPKTKFALHGGQFGTVQEWAKGNSPRKIIKNPNGSSTPKFRDFDYSDPEIQRQLATLQIFDIITGQMDRHTGNYYIYQGPEGTKITAIDNDISFGAKKGAGRMTHPDRKNELSPFDNTRGMPLFLDDQVANRLLEVTPQEMKEVLESLIAPDEVSAALQRFAEVKAHVRKLLANTERLMQLNRRIDEIDETRQKMRGNEVGGDALDAEREDLYNEWFRLFAKGAVIPPYIWGEITARYQNYENSYYGVLKETVEHYRTSGDIVPVD